MKPGSATKILKRLTDHGIPAQRRDSYSGRGMYGRTTVAIVANVSDPTIVEEISPVLGREARRDNMGLGWVWY